MSSTKKWICNLADPSLPQPESSLRVLCFSDTHSMHNKIPKDWFPPADIALFAGDFTSTGSLKDTISFKNFFKTLQCRYKVLIAGNHEVTFDLENRSDIIDHYLRSYRNDYSDVAKEYHKRTGENPNQTSKGYDDEVLNLIKKEITEDNELIYLEESSINIEGLNIYGTPYSPFFYNWGFPTYPEVEKINGGVSASRWSKIPDNTDIVIVHGPPYNIFDSTVDNEHTGCPFLAERMQQIEPSLCIFGHIHEDYGYKKIGNTYYANVSTLNFNYHVQNKPLLFDLIPVTKQ